MFGSARPRQPAAWEGQTLDRLVPRRRIAHETTAEGGLSLLDPRFKGRILWWLLQPRLHAERAHVHVALDERGRFIWLGMDGIRTVAELVVLFVERFPKDIDQAAERVWRYVAVMEHHGFVEFGIVPDGTDREGVAP